MIYLLILLILLQIADCLTTVHILKNGGREANPMMNWLFNKIGTIPSLVIMKLLVIGVMVWAWNIWATLVAVVLYLGVVGWNLYQIWKTK
jgi:hypothetical protein